MNSGNTKTSRFKTVAPLMIYLPPNEIKRLKTFAKNRYTTVSKIAREAIDAKLSGDQNPYAAGFNEGLKKAMELAKDSPGGKMMFPNGKTFAETVCDSIKGHMKHEATAVEKSQRRAGVSPTNPWTSD